MGALLHALLTPAAFRPCRQEEEVRLAQRLRLHCQQCLSAAGPKRETAGVLLGRLLVRSDCRASLRCFVAWATAQLQCTAPLAVFLVPGVCRLPGFWHMSACKRMGQASTVDGTPSKSARCMRAKAHHNQEVSVSLNEHQHYAEDAHVQASRGRW